MANTQNLKPIRTEAEAREKGRRGGKKSGEVRKAKKTIQNLLSDYLESDCKDSPQLKKLAKQLGLDDKDSIKKLMTIKCILNTISKGELKDLELLQNMLEEKETKTTEGVNIIIDV